MIKVGILSDTHGAMPEELYDFFANCDEIWHAGDWGSVELAERLMQFKPLRGVYGNIDGQAIRTIFPEVNQFTCGGLNICLLHIGGYPGRYSPLFKSVLASSNKPDLMVCGHSHILKVQYDQTKKLLHINPGAAGFHGFHKQITAIRFAIVNGKPIEMEIWERTR
jgi:putative phosphoesterase